MIKGSTIIFNEEYISELTRHRDNYKHKFELEFMPNKKKEWERQYNLFENKLEQALDFQDILEEIINIDIPRLTAVKTVHGYCIPLRNVNII